MGKTAKRLIVAVVVAATAWAGDWEAVRRLPVESKVEVSTRDGRQVRGNLLKAGIDAIQVRNTAGEHSMERSEVVRVKVVAPGRRIRRGLMWTAIGALAGAGIGEGVCPYCANEGHGSKYLAPGIAAGAGVGALGFLTSPYRTVFKQK